LIVYLDEDGYRQAVSDLDDDWPAYARLNVSNQLVYHAGEPAEKYALRGYDSVHLASAFRSAVRPSPVATDAILLRAAQ
jgi:predicted nucleic acid-binding protein